MKKLYFLITVVIGMFIFGMVACTGAKSVAYIQDAGEMDMNGYMQTTPLYDAKILPKDLITITVVATDPEAVKPFNLTVPTLTTGSSTYSQPSLQSYLVDNNGQINFPVVGMVTLSGLTKREAEQKITDFLLKYLKEPPVVTVKFVNYKISVLGEVARPNTFTIVNEKVNIFEALAMAGDMTIYGKRDNVKIIREDANGNQNVIVLNLNDPTVIYSPFYFLQQNDVVYVEPNKTKAKSSEIGSATSLWISGTSILISLAGLLVNILSK